MAGPHEADLPLEQGAPSLESEAAIESQTSTDNGTSFFSLSPYSGDKTKSHRRMGGAMGYRAGWF
jgi:hypothetical protein